MYKGVMKNVSVGMFFLVFALVYLLGASRIASFSPFGNRGLDSKSIPQMLGVLMCVLAALQIVLTVRQNKREAMLRGAPEDTKSRGVRGKPSAAQQESWVAKAPVYGSIGLLVAYVVIYNKLGFILSTTIYLLAATTLLTPAEKRRGKAWFIVSLSIVFTLAVYIVFTKYLTLFLPQGILG